jgi:hypothetical protein
MTFSRATLAGFACNIIHKLSMIKSILTALTLSITLNCMAQNKRVVFVCEHGAAKSVIAAAYFNKMAKERNLKYEAICRGNFPDSAVSQSAKQGLIQDRLLDESVQPTNCLPLIPWEPKE